MWNRRERQYVAPYQPEQMTRRLVQQMPLPTEGERSLLQQHIQRFSVFLRNCQLFVGTNKSSAQTTALWSDPMIEFSKNVFDVTDDNDRRLFLAINILHELVHCFELVTVDLCDCGILFSLWTNDPHLQEPVTRTFEQGEIFEIMMFGRIIGRTDDNTIEAWCSVSDEDFQFVINIVISFVHKI